jgi:hypothetical protein
MAKGKLALERMAREISNHKFDTSKYVVFDMSVRRDSATGTLASKELRLKPSKAKLKK